MIDAMNASQLEAILDGPAAVPPLGQTPQLENPPTHRDLSYRIIIALTILAVIPVMVRMYTSIVVTRKLNPADYFLFIGAALYAGLIGVICQAVEAAPGVHQWNVRVRDLRSFLYWIHIGSILYGLIICFIKLSILTLYLQLFMPTKKPSSIYWITIGLMAVNTIAYIILTFVEIFACKPMRKAWDPLVTDGQCIDLFAVNTGATSINTGSDFIILVIPQLVIWRLNMAWKNKASISAVFLVAVLAIACSVIRLYYCVLQQRSDDLTYNGWLAGIWTMPEITLGIIVACMPSFRLFWSSVAKGTVFSTISSSLRSWGNTASEMRSVPDVVLLEEQPISRPSRTWSHRSWPKGYSG